MKKSIFFALALVCCLSVNAQITNSEWKSMNMTNMQLKSWLTTEAGSLADTVTVSYAKYINPYEADTVLYYSFVNNELIEKKDEITNTDEAQYYCWWFGGDLQTYENGHTVIRLSGNISSTTPYSFSAAEDTTYAAFVGKGEFFANPLNNHTALPVTFTSSKPGVVKVNAQTGAIEVMSVGQTVITASYAGEAGVYPAYQASYTMTVVDRPFDDYEFVDLENREPTEYEYWIENGTYYYDPETYTLTLDNYLLIASEYFWFNFFNFGVNRPSPIPLTIYVKGDCKIVSRGGAINAGADVIIRSDKDATLAMFSYIPPIVAHNCVIDGANVSLASEAHPNFEGETFQIKNGSYVHLQENAYIMGEFDHINQLLLGDLQMDTEIGILTKGVHYGTEEIEMWDEKQMVTTFFFADNTLAPVVEIGKVQRPQPITEETTTVSVSMASVDVEYNPAGTDIDGIFYTITENDSIIDAEGCLEISSTMSEIEMQQIASLFSSTSLGLAQSFRGISFILPAGEGEVSLNAQTLGTHQLGVKIGEEQDTLFTLSEKTAVTVKYNIAQPQLVFVYGYVEKAGDDPLYAPYRKMRRAKMEESDGSVKLYDLTITPKKIVTGVEEVLGTWSSSPATKIFRDGQILILRDGKIYTPAGVEVK